MQRNFKLILSIVIVLLSGALAFGQEEQEKQGYKDVTLDGKPAKLNVATGEITFVNPNDKKKPVKLDDYVVSSNKEPKVDKGAESKTNYISIDSDYYTVKEGETLLEIATRYRTTLTELKRVNNMETTLVDVGQRLRVRNFDAIETEAETEVETKVEVATQPNATESNSGFHIVEKGQTLYSLSRLYGLTVNELKQKNSLSSNTIMIGQKLRVSNTDSNEEFKSVSVWTVSKGDTLYNISKRNGITVEAIKNLNGLTSNLILIGQKLQLK